MMEPTSICSEHTWGLEKQAGRVHLKFTALFFPDNFICRRLRIRFTFFSPWIAFHLSPQMIQHSFEHNGVIDMPWPGGNPRSTPGCYGCKWILESSESGQIIQRIDLVRDSALDLKTAEDELRRATLDYPFTISGRDYRDFILDQVKYRKEVPNGFVCCFL